MPTPGIAYLAKDVEADAAIVISASHNPYYDNGIKIFDGKGQSWGIVMSLLSKRQWIKTVGLRAELGKANRVSDAAGTIFGILQEHRTRWF